jgi:hypothetical protein
MAYNQMVQEAIIPDKSIFLDDTIEELMSLVESQRYINQNYVANAAPNIASVLGNLVMVSVKDLKGIAKQNTKLKYGN